jgi:predicted metal-dependent peptidase
MKNTRIRLILDYPFFGILALGIQLVEKYDIKTMAIDGESLFYNPDFVKKLSNKDKMFDYLHELGHVIFLHMFRRGDRDPRLWNIAADHAVNAMLVESTGLTLPEGLHFNEKYIDWPTEKIYDDLKSKYKNQIKPDYKPTSREEQEKLDEFLKEVETTVRNGLVEDAPKDLLEKEVEITISAAVTTNKMTKKSLIKHGSTLDRQIKKMTDKSVDWSSILHRFMNEACQKDYSWLAPNTRYMHATNGLMLPSLKSHKSIKLAVVFDTSISIDMEICSRFFARFESMIETINYAELHVLSCSDQIHNPRIFYPGENIDYVPAGGGLTETWPVWEYFEQNGIVPTCLVYFTDLEVQVWGDNPGYPILWLADCRSKQEYDILQKHVPFGETVYVKNV